ncbi:MAG: EF-hand domain-containing protein [Geminicoccaceae bacterium]
MMQSFDRDGDGSFTQEDVDVVRAQRFAEFDTNGDGALSLEEYEALWLDAMRERMVRGFQLHDRDGDALVTVEEFTLTTGNLVERHDRNGDGVVSRDELQRRPHGEGRRGGQRPRQAPEGDNPN